MKYKFLEKPATDSSIPLSAKRKRSSVCENPEKHAPHDDCPGRQRAAKTERVVDPEVLAALEAADWDWGSADKNALGLIDKRIEEFDYDFQACDEVEDHAKQHQKLASFFTTIKRINAIIRDYAAQGLLPLTVRQLHYQMVVRHKDYLNTATSYAHLDKDIADARMCGLVPWNGIADPTRDVHALATWKTPRDRIEFSAQNYRLDRWANQPCSPILLVEKDAVLGLVSGICNSYAVPYLSCKGYGSLSALRNEVAQHCRRAIDENRTPIVFHLSDHDATGVDMERNLSRRLNQFTDELIDVRHIALTADQIRQYNLLPDPVKTTDPRYSKYIDSLSDKELEEGAWEMDALDPGVLRALIESAITAPDVLDRERWGDVNEQEEKDKQLLQRVAKRWDKIVRLLEK